ncbi:hypothetical protein F5Y04DRAFT_240928 [Hypomontagnella monticulosa]|nr:hypothetical protein F5Y04DRAFT_240928 [Hypomontagnella monticulosa]
MESQSELPQAMEGVLQTPNYATKATNTEISPLLRVPLEVLLLISSYLTTQEYGVLRRVCRQLELSLFKEFSSEFFTKRSFMLTEHSLSTLVDISKSRLSTSVAYLTISLKHPSPSYHGPIGTTVPTDSEAGIRSNYLRQEIMDHQALINSGYDLELLTEAFQNLPSLQTVSLRDFDSTGRNRDGSGVWRPYGAPTISIKTGYNVEAPRYARGIDIGFSQGANYVSRTFLTVLRALGNTKGPNTPPRLEAILRKCHLPEVAFYIPPRLEPVILPVLKDLTTIFLELGPSSLTGRIVTNMEYCSGFQLTAFLSRTTSLEHLRLNFRDCVEDESNSLFKWLTQSPESRVDSQVDIPEGTIMVSVFPQIPAAPSLPRLEQLDIGMATIELRTLVNLVKRFRSSLRRISLHKVTLHDPTAKSCRINIWAKLINQLCKSNLQLSAINFSFLKQVNRRHVYHVSFLEDHQNPDNRSLTKEWAGKDFQRNSKDLIESMFVAWPGTNGEGDELSSDSESFDDDGEVEIDLDEDVDDDPEDDI